MSDRLQPVSSSASALPGGAASVSVLSPAATPALIPAADSHAHAHGHAHSHGSADGAAADEPAAPAPLPVAPITADEINEYFRESEARLTHLEQLLDRADLIPGLSVLSGFARTLLGICQVVWYVAKAALNYIVSLCKRDNEKANLRAFASRELELVQHGLANILKGALFMGLPISSNAYAWVNELRDVKYRFAYETETVSPETHRLFNYNSSLGAAEQAAFQKQMQLKHGENE